MKLLKKIQACIKQARADIECGTHSGFKPCCIFCFAILDNISVMNNATFYTWRRVMNHAISTWRNDSGHGYVPCPVCLFRAPVPVKNCRSWQHSFRMTKEDWSDMHGSFINYRNMINNISNKQIKVKKIIKILKDNKPVVANYFQPERTDW